MSVKYKLIKKVNPRDLDAAPKYYAIALSDEMVGIDRLAELMSDGSSLRENDINASIIGSVNAIIGELSEGRSVNLDPLGIFSVLVNSKGVTEKTAHTTRDIIGRKIRFRPSLKLKKMLAGLTFVKID